MSLTMEDDIKRWTAKRKAALVMEIIQGKTSISEASRAFDVSPAEIEEWVDEAKRGMENALRARKKYQALAWWTKRTRNDPWDTAGFEIRRHQSKDQPTVPLV